MVRGAASGAVAGLAGFFNNASKLDPVPVVVGVVRVLRTPIRDAYAVRGAVLIEGMT
jgi:hypothetical protein